MWIASDYCHSISNILALYNSLNLHNEQAKNIYRVRVCTNLFCDVCAIVELCCLDCIWYIAWLFKTLLNNLAWFKNTERDNDSISTSLCHRYKNVLHQNYSHQMASDTFCFTPSNRRTVSHARKCIRGTSIMRSSLYVNIFYSIRSWCYEVNRRWQLP